MKDVVEISKEIARKRMLLEKEPDHPLRKEITAQIQILRWVIDV